MLTPQQKTALRKAPSCVEMDELDGTWEHVVYRIEHPVCMQDDDSYTPDEVNECKKWLRKYAPSSKYAR